MGNNEHIKVLLVEDNRGDARLTKTTLDQSGTAKFDVSHVVRLSAALDLLDVEDFDVALLDLSLPDAQGLEGLNRVREKCDELPIVVLSGLDDEQISVTAVQKGAQDYLVKGQGTVELMVRAIRYSIERKRGERLILEAKEQAEVANQAKSDFLAAMSHELRTPLNAIIGFSEVMMHEQLGPIDNESYASYVEHIHASGAHLLGIISDILDLAKIEARSEDLHEERVGIANIVEASVRMLGNRAEQEGVTISVDLGACPAEVRGDRRRLQQILVNLLSNAVKFTMKGGRVAVTTSLDEAGNLAIAVTDTGAGMAPDDIPRALAAFQQLDDVLNRKHGGTGLGLSLTKRLAELHGATLEIESELGSGTCVTVRLPSCRVLQPEFDSVTTAVAT